METWKPEKPLRTAKLAAKRLRNEFLAELCPTLCERLNELCLGRPWHHEANPSLKCEGEFLVRCFSKSAALELVFSISGTIAGLEIAINADWIHRRDRVFHADRTFPLAEVEAAFPGIELAKLGMGTIPEARNHHAMNPNEAAALRNAGLAGPEDEDGPNYLPPLPQSPAFLRKLELEKLKKELLEAQQHADKLQLPGFAQVTTSKRASMR